MNEKQLRKAWKEHYLQTPNEKLLILESIADWGLFKVRKRDEELLGKIKEKVVNIEYGTPEIEQQYWDRGYNSALADIKQIINNEKLK